MLIVCQNCGTSYKIDPASLGPSGRSVRCARCNHVWFTANTGAIAEIAQAHRAEASEFAAAATVGDLADPPAPPAGRAPPAAVQAPPQAESVLGPVPADFAPLPRADATTIVPPPEIPANDRPPQQPVTIDDGPPLAPIHPGRTARADSTASEDIESVAARRSRRQAARRRRSWPMPALSTAILALVAVNLGLIAWRAEIVRWLPQTASLYAALRLPVNLRGLEFVNVGSETETHEGVQVLVIEGAIASMAGRAVEVPRLRFSVRNASGHEIYAWTSLPGKTLLQPGETLAFRSRLASPPREAHDVLVRFFNRRDLLAGAQ